MERKGRERHGTGTTQKGRDGTGRETRRDEILEKKNEIFENKIFVTRQDETRRDFGKKK